MEYFNFRLNCTDCLNSTITHISNNRVWNENIAIMNVIGINSKYSRCLLSTLTIISTRLDILKIILKQFNSFVTSSISHCYKYKYKYIIRSSGVVLQIVLSLTLILSSYYHYTMSCAYSKAKRQIIESV